MHGKFEKSHQLFPQQTATHLKLEISSRTSTPTVSLEPGSGAVDAARSRLELTAELHARYRSARVSLMRLHYKRAVWFLVVGGAKCLKRLIDIVVTLALLTALAPLFAAIGLAIKLSGGSVLFWQTRVGLWGREFPFPKFRSMVPNAEALKENLQGLNQHGTSVTFKMKNDPRVTWIGRILRRWSLDELPQLWCVLRGDMSLVGPRPPVPTEVAKYTLRDRRRLDVKPGLTCIWQVSGRGDIPFAEQAELDIRYINSQSLLMDIRLLAQTVPAVLLGKGAY